MTTFTCLCMKGFKEAWVESAPDIQHPSNVLLYVNSATDVDMNLTRKGMPPPLIKRMVVAGPVVTPLACNKELYDPMGLYPCAIIRPRFLLPCVFSPTKFVHRHLSIPEKCALFDVPPAFLGALSQAKLKQFHNELCIPLRLFQQMGERVLQTFQGTQVKRKLVQVEIANKKLKPLTSALAPTVLHETPPQSSVAGPPLDRNLKAVKADNAGVHVDLWNIEIARGLSSPLPQDWESSRGPAQCFRMFLFGVWKCRVTSSFWIWFRQYCPISDAHIVTWSVVHRKYCWIDRMAYTSDWRNMHKASSTSIMAARDCI